MASNPGNPFIRPDSPIYPSNETIGKRRDHLNFLQGYRLWRVIRQYTGLDVQYMAAEQTSEVITQLKRQIAVETDRGRNGHPRFDRSRLIALRQAVTGLGIQKLSSTGDISAAGCGVPSLDQRDSF